jgi:hypothetical protein
MHDDGVRLHARGALGREPVARVVLAQAREQRLTQSLLLDPEHVRDVDLTEEVVEIVGDGDGQPSSRSGMSVGGPTNVTCAPSRVKHSKVLRATREWRMSPMIAMRQPSSDGPRWRRSVNASSNAWVGCSCRPSPAFTTDASIH